MHHLAALHHVKSTILIMKRLSAPSLFLTGLLMNGYARNLTISTELKSSRNEILKILNSLNYECR
jgi:hypothetical protein